MASGSESDYLGSDYKFTTIRERLAGHAGPSLDFALGRHQEPPPEWVPGFVREHAGLALRAGTSAEKVAFAETAARMLSRVYGARVSPASILPAPSGRAAMSALAATLISPGDRVLVTEPGYPAFARVAAQAHARVTAASLDPERGFAPKLEGLDAPGDGAIRLAALNYPNNPTGSVLADAALETLAGRLDPGAAIFNDAVYGPLTFARDPFSMLSDRGVEVTGRPLIELHSLGKLFSLGPLGVAFLVGPEELIRKVRQYSDYAWSQTTSLQIAVCTRCIEDWGHVEGVRDRLRQRLDALRHVVTGLGFRPYPTQAGMYLLCPRPAEAAGRPVASAAAAADRLFESHGLALAAWDVPPHGYLRFSSAYLPEDLASLAALGAGVPVVSG